MPAAPDTKAAPAIAADPEAAPILQHLAQHPLEAEGYQALLTLYAGRQDRERTFAVCAALVLLHKAEAENLEFYHAHRPHRVPRSQTCLSDDAWAGCVYRSDENRFISGVFSIISGAVGQAKSKEHRLFGLKRGERCDLRDNQTLFAHTFSYSADVLNVPLPETYLRPEDASSLKLACTRDKGHFLPSVVVGQLMLGGQSEKELAFRSAAFLSKLRPAYLPRLLMPTLTEMRVALLGAASLVAPEAPAFAPAPEEDKIVAEYRELLQASLSPAAREALTRCVQHSQHNAGALNLEQWTRSVDFAANRAGLIVSGDLEAAVQVLNREPVVMGGQSTHDRLKDLLLYSVSPRYFAARHFLGIELR